MKKAAGAMTEEGQKPRHAVQRHTHEGAEASSAAAASAASAARPFFSPWFESEIWEGERTEAIKERVGRGGERAEKGWGSGCRKETKGNA